MEKTLKLCRTCKFEKPICHFGPHPKSADGKHYQCRLCKATETRARNKKHPERKRAFDKRYRKNNLQKLRSADKERYAANREIVRDRNLRSFYGITLKQFDAMLAQQRGACASCGTTKTNGWQKNFCVDHCHKSGKVRGILCSKCNLALGYLDDDPEKIKALLAYIS